MLSLQFQQLVSEERQKWDLEKDVEVEEQQANMRSEVERTSRQLHEELEHERSLVQALHRQIDSLRMVNTRRFLTRKSDSHALFFWKELLNVQVKSDI